jgi:hypothetical protein
MGTLNSSLVSYLTPQNFLNYVSVNTVADFLGDRDRRVSANGPFPDPNQIAGNPILNQFLLAASGELEAAVLAGTRYAIADLALLAGSASGELLNSIIAGLTLGLLWRRRPDKGPPPESVVEARAMIERLRGGEEVFGILENQQAGIASNHVDTPHQVFERGLIETVAVRYYGSRTNLRCPRGPNGFGWGRGGSF